MIFQSSLDEDTCYRYTNPYIFYDFKNSFFACKSLKVVGFRKCSDSWSSSRDCGDFCSNQTEAQGVCSDVLINATRVCLNATTAVLSHWKNLSSLQHFVDRCAYADPSHFYKSITLKNMCFDNIQMIYLQFNSVLMMHNISQSQ